MNEVPPTPPGWNLTFADLLAEMKAGKRKSIGRPELHWARDYERSLIPAHMHFPQQGDVYEATADVQVRYLTSWAAPFTGGGDGVLLGGERVFVEHAPVDTKPIGVNAVALNYAPIERRIVPEAERQQPKYRGYYFSLKTVELNTKFKLVQTGFKRNVELVIEADGPSATAQICVRPHADRRS